MLHDHGQFRLDATFQHRYAMTLDPVEEVEHIAEPPTNSLNFP
jgi:hypothetical protein